MSTINYGVAWNDSYKLGNELVDGQHMQLFRLVSELVTACIEHKDIANLRETLNFLVEYTIKHFHDEEALQVRYNFPEYKRHKQLHENFKVTVGKLVKRFEQSGSSELLSSDVNKLVIRWLISHISIEDKKIGDHIKKLTA